MQSKSRYLILWSDQYKAKLVFDFVAWSLQIFCNFDYEKVFQGQWKLLIRACKSLWQWISNSNKDIFPRLVFNHPCSYAKQSRYLILWSDQYKAKLFFWLCGVVTVDFLVILSAIKIFKRSFLNHSCSYAKQSRYLTLWSDQYKANLVFDFVAWSLQIFCNFDY